MAGLLLALVNRVVPLLHPGVPYPGQMFVGALAEWVPEGAPDVHMIDEAGFVCPLGRSVMGRELIGYANLDGTVRTRSLDRGIADALAHGVVTAKYHRDAESGLLEDHPRHRLTDVVAAAVARATALADVTTHLTTRPVDVVQIDGVTPDAKALTGRDRSTRTFERTVEVHYPQSPAEAAHALLRKTELEHVGRLGHVDHPEWCPTGFVAAHLLRALVTDLTGVEVCASTPPRVLYVGANIVWTPELAALLPELAVLPARFFLTLDDNPEDRTSTWGDALALAEAATAA